MDRPTFEQSKAKVNTQKLKGAEKTKYEIYHSIKGALAMAKNWKQFEHILSLQVVDISYKYKGQTDVVQGISFKKGEYSFKGSEVDRAFSYSKLDIQLQTNELKMKKHNLRLSDSVYNKFQLDITNIRSCVQIVCTCKIKKELDFHLTP